MKVEIYCEESYPVYTIQEPRVDLNLECIKLVSVPEELWERYQKIEKEYEGIQRELSTIHEGIST